MSADTSITSPASGNTQKDSRESDKDYASNADLHISNGTPRRDYGTDRQQPDTGVDDATPANDLNTAINSEDDSVPDDTDAQDGADADANDDKNGNVDPGNDVTDYDPVENRPRGDQYAPVE